MQNSSETPGITENNKPLKKLLQQNPHFNKALNQLLINNPEKGHALVNFLIFLVGIGASIVFVLGFFGVSVSTNLGGAKLEDFTGEERPKDQTLPETATQPTNNQSVQGKAMEGLTYPKAEKTNSIEEIILENLNLQLSRQIVNKNQVISIPDSQSTILYDLIKKTKGSDQNYLVVSILHNPGGLSQNGVEGFKSSVSAELVSSFTEEQVRFRQENQTVPLPTSFDNEGRVQKLNTSAISSYKPNIEGEVLYQFSGGGISQSPLTKTDREQVTAIILRKDLIYPVGF